MILITAVGWAVRDAVRPDQYLLCAALAFIAAAYVVAGPA
jgi:hypothetical protein